jgi:hypothetical protein
MTAAELISHYAEVRRRLVGTPRRVSLHRPSERLWHTPFNCPPTPPRIMWQRILWECGIKYGVSNEDIQGPGRRVPVVKARHEAMRRMYREVRIMGKRPSLEWVGARCGGRDHSCVLNALKLKRQRPWKKKA